MAEAWLNRIGLTLQFVALFLVTPDIIGKERMIAAMDRTSAWFKRHRSLMWLIAGGVGAVLLLTFVLIGISIQAANETEESSVSLAIQILLTVIATIATDAIPRLAVSVWTAISKATRSLFPMGAALFTVGYVCLMWATFVSE